MTFSKDTGKEGKVAKVDYIKLRHFCAAKGNSQHSERKITECRIIFFKTFFYQEMNIETKNFKL